MYMKGTFQTITEHVDKDCLTIGNKQASYSFWIKKNSNLKDINRGDYIIVHYTIINKELYATLIVRD